jgi:hypothetical protein
VRGRDLDDVRTGAFTDAVKNLRPSLAGVSVGRGYQLAIRGIGGDYDVNALLLDEGD